MSAATFLLRDPWCIRHHFTVTIIIYYFSYLLFILLSLPLSLSQTVWPNYCVYLCFVKNSEEKNQLSPYNLSSNKLSALTPPPERFGQLLKWIKVTLYLQIGWPLVDNAIDMHTWKDSKVIETTWFVICVWIGALEINPNPQIKLFSFHPLHVHTHPACIQYTVCMHAYINYTYLYFC